MIAFRKQGKAVLIKTLGSTEAFSAVSGMMFNTVLIGQISIIKHSHSSVPPLYAWKEAVQLNLQVKSSVCHDTSHTPLRDFFERKVGEEKALHEARPPTSSHLTSN